MFLYTVRHDAVYVKRTVLGGPLLFVARIDRVTKRCCCRYNEACSPERAGSVTAPGATCGSLR